MKSRTLKSLVLVMCAVFVISLLVGCAKKPAKYEDREVGDFVVRFYEDYDYCEIKGTTAQGNEKRFLVIPEYVDGVRVESLGIYYPFPAFDGTRVYRPEIDSDKLEKVYFEATTKMARNSFDVRDSYGDDLCPNIRKIFYPGLEVYPYSMTRHGYTVYYPRRIYENDRGAFYTGYSNTMPANVSYYYNYENAKNSGYYWIDDYDYGEKIELIPSDPTRDGYTFDGWHKNVDCMSEWDFDTDTLPEKKMAQVEGNGGLVERAVYQETILYARWLPNQA